MPGPRECMPQHHYTGPTSTYDEAHPLLQASPPSLADTTKESLKAVHTAAVSKSRRKQTVNRVLRDRPHDISETETSLRRPQRTTLSQLRSGHCHLLNSYKHRIGREHDPSARTADLTTRK